MLGFSLAMFVTIRVHPDELNDTESHKALVAKGLGVSPDRISGITLEQKGLDARHAKPRYELSYRAWVDQKPEHPQNFEPRFSSVEHQRPVVVVGAGPSGLFAALKLIELGYKPIIVERGKPVRSRRRDIADLCKRGALNPESNYCFGEGGAGTFSDGKLYTRSTKRGSTRTILETLVYFGAPHEILLEAHPHIGTNKLPKVISRISDAIQIAGGQILFNERLTELKVLSSKVSGIKTASGRQIDAPACILATGHSARDVYYMLNTQGIRLEQKPFALGLRVEHPQELIDSLQYGNLAGHPNLPPASYSLKCQLEDRSAFSFCMCPGGIICPAATAPSEVVTNGWSPSRRDSRFANAGIVVEVKESDLEPFSKGGVFRGVGLQEQIEKQAFTLGGGSMRAPAQRLEDFTSDTLRNELPECSYIPGTTIAPLGELFPDKIFRSLKAAFRAFEKKRPGFLSPEAIVVGPETRTSSPIRIPRDRTTMMHPELDGLFPSAEGAGYAGGIMSAAIDGQNAALAVARYLSRGKK